MMKTRTVSMMMPMYMFRMCMRWCARNSMD